jgi:hypothetical protein
MKEQQKRVHIDDLLLMSKCWVIPSAPHMTTKYVTDYFAIAQRFEY